MADVLVVGGGGFLGSHLVDALLLDGHRVTVFDRFSMGVPDDPRASLTFLQADFLNRAALADAVVGQDWVFHFLSTTTPATAQADPTLDIRTNIVQSVELFQSCVDAGVEHVYFSSTGGAIYGPQPQTEFTELDRTQPISPYGIAKLAIENYLQYFSSVHGLRSTVLRISNPYGTRQHPNRQQGFIPIALRQIIEGRPVVQYGDGSMVRDYIYVDDLVTMVMALTRQPPQSDVYNLGSGRGASVAEVLAAIRRVTAIDFVVDQRDKPPTFVDHSVLNIDRYIAEFGPMTFTSLDEGIRRTYLEMRGH